ncbi:predicted protein [Scheffersomyces stipitis CBS 6054]|uniref:Proteasome activator BLM10 n=1 Tax=Scheffersomyces stipitis (strain ATCC 58785 / CBS 6054 / NBRC 10063 / NRRL Y-11545) TaxID=322104 RepID=A3LTX4_PICST|nr:predicted protein [Scheffersomyces stipitis CBS 6054]ABN66488.2 predicted protein [Scheffersomyces stipitis CBS 6054]
MVRRPSYSTIESSRESHYNLDYPTDRKLLSELQLDSSSRFYARSRKRTLDLPSLLPYATENPQDQAKFLSHIVSHLYIAIKTLDIQGSLSVSAKDIAALKDIAGLSDIDLALETNLFEMNASSQDLAQTEGAEDENYLSVEYDTDTDHEGEDEEDDADEDDGESEGAVQHKKSPKSAAVVSVRTWTHELLVWLKMKYDMPVKLRMSLAKVYYAICLSRGQHIGLKTYVKVFELLTKDVRLLKQQHFKLDWKQLQQELSYHFPPVDTTLDQFEKKEHKQILRLAARASHFFPEDSLASIYKKLGSQFSITNASLVMSSMSLLPHTFVAGGEDNENDIRHYIPSFFYMWQKLSHASGFDAQVTARLGVVAMSALTKLNDDASAGEYLKLGKFGIFTEDQMEYLINSLINSLSIMVEKYSSLKTKYFHGFASAIVYSLNGSSALEPHGLIYYLRTLLNAIESYVHPSNTGEWSRPISKLVLSLIYQFHKRFNTENEKAGVLHDLPVELKLSDEVVTEFVTMFLPIIRTGIQSKKSSATDDYLSSVQLLAFLKPDMVLEYLLVDIYESLQGVISTHRVIIALRTIESLSRFFASRPIFRVHVTTILQLALPGIDTNDLEKTIHTLDVFASISNFAPFHDLTNGYGDPAIASQFVQGHLEHLKAKMYIEKEEIPFEVNHELELEALKSSTSAFKRIMNSLSERLFTLLKNIPDPSKSDGIEKDLAESLPKFLYVLLESLSDDIFESFRNEFFDFVLNNTYHTIADVSAEICGGLIKRDPKSFKKYSSIFIDRIIEEVEENGAGVSRTGVEILPRDQALFWNLVILNECIGNAGTYVVDSSKKLMKLSYFLMEHVKGPTVFSSSYLVNQMLQAVTKVRLNENRIIAPAYESKYGVDEKCWGAFQFDEDRFSEEKTNFDWFIPTDKEISFAVECFNGHVSKSLDNISNLMKSFNKESHLDASKSLQLSDELRMNLLYLGYCLSGVSYLLDPSFNEDIPKLNHQSESIQQHPDDQQEEEKEKITHFQDQSYSAVREHFFASLGKSESLEMPITADISARATPQIEGVDMSSMNPAITFRERKLYTSNYYFGDDMENRKSSDLYLKLHKTYHLIGKSLHIICKFLTANFLDNTKIFKHFIYVANIWFADVGRERMLDSSHARINYGYVSSIQSINRVRKPFTRIAISARLEAYHSLRVALHATSRTQTDLDRFLLEDIVKLSVSTYIAIAKSSQSLLLDAMKRLNGSYSVIVKSAFKYLTRALDENDHKKIESGLSIFSLRRIKTHIRNDFFNVQKYVELLLRCLDVDSVEVHNVAHALYDGVFKSITPPSSVCLIDHSEIDTIRPPDEFIDLEIKAVRFAKERKRKLYFDKLKKLENSVLAKEKSNSHWKTTSLNLSLLINLQSYLEIPTSDEVLQLLAKEASRDHPTISRLALKGVTRIVNKLNLLSTLDYKLENAYDFNFVPKGLKLVDTRPKKGESYFVDWRKELRNVSEPTYFVDHKASTGWLFWNDAMPVIAAGPVIKMSLEVSDELALKGFSSYVSKEWFKNIVKLWVTDNDANSAYQGTDVFVTSTLVTLISKGYIEGMTFDDLLDIVQEIYVKDDKSAHIVVCELLAGILLGSKNLRPELAKKRDEFVPDFLRNILESDLSPDNKGIWNIFAWWIPSHIDCRRFPEVFDVFTDMTIDHTSDSAFKEATKISYIRSVVAAITWCSPNPGKIMDLCLKNINHRYEAVRTQIGSLMAVMSFPYYSESVADSSEFIQRCKSQSGLSLYDVGGDNKLISLVPQLFEQIENWRKEVRELPPQIILRSDYIYAATTVLTWLRQELNTSISVLFQPYVTKYLVPFLLELINMKEVCQLGNIDPISVVKKVSQIPYSKKHLDDIVQMLEKYSKEDLNIIQTIIVGEFTETIYFKNLFLFDKSQRKRIFEVTYKLMYHKNVEIREFEASTLSGLIYSSPPDEVEERVNTYTKAFSKEIDIIRKKYRKSGYKNISPEDTIILHGATLGLGALVHAFSFSSPPPKWVPSILTILSNKASGIPGLVGKTAKESLGKFKKNRQDTWHIDSKVFSESEMEDLEGVLWKSYFI